MILFLFFENKMNSFLIPKMQLYLSIAIIFLFLIGIILVFSNKKEKIIISDFLLVVPIMMFLFIGDGKFNINYASTRSYVASSSNINKNNKKEVEESSNTSLEREYTELSNIEIEVEDESYAGLSDVITYSKNPEKIVGKTIRVRGFIIKNSSFIPDGTFGIGKYLISCCAADASFIGFIVKTDTSSIKENGWYEIEGVLDLGKDTYGSTIVVINMVNYKKIKSEKNQYVYPCYSYGDGSCSEVLKYHLN